MRPVRTTLAAEDEPESDPQQGRQAALFLAFDRDGFAAGPARYLLGDVLSVRVGRGPSRGADIEETAGTRELQIRVSDPRISSTHFCICRRGGGWELVDAGARNGTFVNSQKVETTLLADGD